MIVKNRSVEGFSFRTLVIVSILFFLHSCNNKTEKPNVIFFLADDLGYTDLGVMGSKYYLSPNIDKLSKEGLTFTNAYANAPNCAPTRASLMSGLYTPRHKIYTVNSSSRGQSRNRKIIPTPNETILDSSFITIAESLQENGYESVSIGKWHLGDPGSGGPEEQGFAKNIAGTHVGHPASYFSPYKNKTLKDGPKGEYLPERMATEAIDQIKRMKDKPFFLYLPFFSVHTPIQARKDDIEFFNNQTPDEYHNNSKYAGMIRGMDDAIGRILSAVEEMGLSENTMIIFFSDNGGHGGVTNSYPLKGMKGMLYEGGIREPLFIKWPGNITAGSSTDEPVIGLDLHATILDITQTKTSKKLDGVSLQPLFSNESIEKRSLYWHFPAYLEMMNSKKKEWGSHWRTSPASAIRQGEWKYIYFYEEKRGELYNLEKDIGESNDLASSNHKISEQMHVNLFNWLESVNASTQFVLNPEYDPIPIID